jgi:nucleotide-binding universal stress UspA family protein
MADEIASAPIVMVAIDLAEGAGALNDELRVTAERMLATLPSARLACVNVLKLGRVTIDKTLDEHGHNKHVDRLVQLRHWAEPLKLEDNRLTVHVLEAIDPASSILDFVEASHDNHILIGARRNSTLRKLLGSVSAKVAAEAPCTVTVVRRAAGLKSEARMSEPEPEAEPSA